MTVPTREELAALAETCEIAARTLGRSAASIIQDGTEDAARGRREGNAAADLLMRAADRLRSYPPLEAEGSEEEEILRFPEPQVLGTVDAEHGATYDRPTFAMLAERVESTVPVAEGEREELAELLSEHADEVTQQDLDRAAALLRAPAGVDLEAVLRLVAGTRHTTCLPGLTAHRADAAFANLLAAIRDLPEAKPT